MATVNVSNWNEFVTALGVSGDTVVLPENAEWDMNAILPYGLTANVSIACSKIEGNGTRIKNLNLNGYCFQASGNDIKYFRNLLCTDWIANGEFFYLRYGSEFYACAMSGITAGSCIVDCNNNYENSKAVFISCSFNIESSSNSFTFTYGTSDKYYCRIEVHASNATTSNPIGTNLIFCELILYFPNVTTITSSYYKGCTMRGNMTNVTTESSWTGDWKGHPTVYVETMFDSSYTPRKPDHFIAVTDEQMKTASYLAGLDFPIAG